MTLWTFRPGPQGSPVAAGIKYTFGTVVVVRLTPIMADEPTEEISFRFGQVLIEALNINGAVTAGKAGWDVVRSQQISSIPTS